MTSESSSVVDPVAKLAEEFMGRYRLGERPALAEYTDRHPELAERIRQVFPMMVMMEEAGSGGEMSPSATHEHAAADTSEVVKRLERVGGYRIMREIGRGGMGVVYEAEQVTLGRRVALKVLPLLAAKEGTGLERFRREARAAAKLHHTNIVPVYEVGEDGDVCYYAMQYIHGQALDEVLDELHKLREASRGRQSPEQSAEKVPANIQDPPGAAAPGSPRRTIAQSLLTGAGSRSHDREGVVGSTSPPLPDGRGSDKSSSVSLPGQQAPSAGDKNRWHYYRSVARVGVQVAQALEYAHREGVIHRDIKPSNLLLDTESRVWVTDFGLAKYTPPTPPSEGGEDWGGALTHTGDIVGTIRYMAPERFRGWSDPRSDVYSLGLTLYEMLLLEPAFQAADRMKLIRLVTDSEPARLRKADPAIARDLETIVQKAIDKEPGRRYQTAAELAGDLQRFVEDKPIQARRISGAERAWRWCRRNPVVTGLTAGLTALLLVLAVGGPLMFLRQTFLTSEEARARQDAEQARDKEQQARRTADQNLYVADMNLAQEAYEEGNVQRALDLLERHRTSAWRGFEWRYLWRLCQEGDALRTLSGHSKAVNAVAFSKDGLLATGGQDGLVKLWDAAGQQVVATLRHTSGVRTIAFSPDGELLAAGSDDGTARVWHVATRQEVGSFMRRQAIYALAFSADGKLLAISGGTQTSPLSLWDVAARQRLPDADVLSVKGIAFSPDNKTLACASPGVNVRLWDVAGQRESAVLPGPHTSFVIDVAFSPDSKVLATCSWDTMICLWDAQTLRDGQPPRLLATLKGHRSYVNSLAFSPDGQTLASASEDATLKLWHVGKGLKPEVEPFATLRGHTGPVYSVSFSPDGKHLASASADGTAKLWAAQGRQERDVLTGPEDWVYSVAISPDGRLLAAGVFGGAVWLWDLLTLQRKDVRQAHALDVFTVAFSPDGKWLTSCDGVWRTAPKGAKPVPSIPAFVAPGQVKLWKLAEPNHEISLPGYATGIRGLDFSADGKTLATGDHNGEVKFWDLSGPEPRLSPPVTPHKSRIDKVQFSPDGKTLAIISYPAGRALTLWSVEGQKAAMTVPIDPLPTGAGAFGVAFSPDGKLVASGGTTVKLWDTATLKELASLDGHKAVMMGIAFSPDGKTLATASLDHTVKLWSVAIGQEVATLKGHRGPVSGLAFSRDGTLLVSSSEDKTIRLWRAVADDAVIPANR